MLSDSKRSNTPSLHLMETFSRTGRTPLPGECVPLRIYEYTGNGMTSHLALAGSAPEDPMDYLASFSPEMYDSLLNCLARGSMFLDLDRENAAISFAEGLHAEASALAEGFAAISAFPKRQVDVKAAKGLVSVILCAGKGSRMRSKDLHKVCFPVAGKPAVNRLLDQLETAGIREHVVVVGEKGRQVVRTIAEVRDNAAFVYQVNQNGTGNAAKQAAYLLRAQEYEGDVLIIPGDKMFEVSALERLLRTHRESGADVSLMVADKKWWPDSGRIVHDRRGRPVDIVEKRDVQRMILSGRLLERVGQKGQLTADEIREAIRTELPSESKARLMFPDLMEYLDGNDTVSAEELNRLIPSAGREYIVPGNDGGVRLSGEELERTTPVINAFVYLISAKALYRAIFSLGTENAQKEEYLTDVIRMLARDPEHEWKIIPVPVRDEFEVMSFNNPEELLRIEERYNARESVLSRQDRSCERIEAGLRESAVRPATEWVRILEEFGPEVRAVFRKTYGDRSDLLDERREAYLQALRKYIRVFGAHHPVVISRSPGRVNLMGRHVEHRGGYTNYMAISREVILVAGVREDDIIELHNMDASNFRPRNFSIGDELAQLPWDEWLNMINSEKVLEIIRSSRGDWSNYFRASALRLQEKYKGRLLYGFNGVLSGKIPLAAGLSSSSAVVVAAAEALTFINGLSIQPNDFVDMCGEGEWFVGTRGGSGDHAAMKFAEKGSIIHMGFHPIRVETVVPFPTGYVLFILQSHQSARKSENAMQVFNEKVATYEVAQTLVKARFPHLRERIVHLRDINAENLGLRPHEIYDILLALPDRISRKELLESLEPEEHERMERVFSSHQEPMGGYEARRVALYGLAEIRRAMVAADLLRGGDMEGLGRLMCISHDGDRVSCLDEQGNRVPYDNSATETLVRDLRDRMAAGDSSASLEYQPGGYACSTPLIDEMVDTALSIPGVMGTQLSGAGLGGCIMALVREDAAERFSQSMTDSFYARHDLDPSVEICFPIEGSGVVAV